MILAIECISTVALEQKPNKVLVGFSRGSSKLPDQLFPSLRGKEASLAFLNVDVNSRFGDFGGPEFLKCFT